MGYTITQPSQNARPEKLTPLRKIASGEFFVISNKISLRNGRQSSELHQKNRSALTKTASGRSVWLNRDPIEEDGGFNL